MPLSRSATALKKTYELFDCKINVLRLVLQQNIHLFLLTPSLGKAGKSFVLFEKLLQSATKLLA